MRVVLEDEHKVRVYLLLVIVCVSVLVHAYAFECAFACAHVCTNVFCVNWCACDSARLVKMSSICNVLPCVCALCSQVVVFDMLSESSDDLEFRDRVVKISLGAPVY